MSFKVYYRCNGKPRLLWDIMYGCKTADEAKAKLMAFAKELGDKIEIVKAEAAQ